MKNRLSLIVDGNWLLLTQVFANSKMIEQDTDEAYLKLKKSYISSILSVLENLPVIDNCIVVADQGSWRSKLQPPRTIDKLYKGNRKSSDKYNWDNIWQAYDEILNALRKMNATVSRAPEIEGDDWCAYWVSRLSKDGISSLIWSRDHDLQQLVSYNVNCFVGWWNEKDGLVMHEEANSDYEFFVSLTPAKILLNNLPIRNITYINPTTDILIPKILNGDLSDNIGPVLYRIKNDRTYKLTAKELPDNLNIDDSESISQFIREKLTEDKYSWLDYEQVMLHIEYNRQLVVLQSKYYPQYIIERLRENIPPYTQARIHSYNFDNSINTFIDTL